MLKQEELTEALHAGLKGSERCTNFCRAGAEISENGYKLFHNGTGSRDTDAQRVHADATLRQNKDQLGERIKAWVAGLHTGVRLDLNAATFETRGPALAGWPWRSDRGGV